MTPRPGSRALTALNGAMAAVCVAATALVGLLVLCVAVLSLSMAAAWPPGGFDLPWTHFHMHVSPNSRSVISGFDTCVTPPAGGKPACTHTTRTVTSVRPADSQSVITGVCIMTLALPLTALGYGLAHAGACFAGLARGRWFARGTVTHLRDFAVGGLLFVALSPLPPRLAPWIGRTADGLLHPGQTGTSTWTTNLDLGPLPAFLTLIYAVLLAVITAVLAHARKVADDHAQIV